MEEQYCHYCHHQEQPVEVRYVGEVGVAYLCPVHGHCSRRWDSMTPEQMSRWSQAPLGYYPPQ